ncbi:MAG TPA: alpha-amylase family glycosyl hydrolase [Steroidobacteraceae bacterium]|nr:alpha-amylase family glycosyl hydrolase [Steroidobacteraceae bacterium]
MRRGWGGRVSFLLWIWIVLAVTAAASAGRTPRAPRGPFCDAVRCMVLYDASPFFFAPGGRGGFAAIEAHLPSIRALGANAILLSPVTAASPGDFGYAVTDDFRLRSSFGTEAQFRSLIRAAHALGLRVLLDMVANHLSDQSPYYRDAERRGRRSPYYGWFERDRSGRAVHYFHWTNLENLNYDDAAVRRYILAAIAHWLAGYHVDGFRLDAAWAVRQRDPEFWPTLRSRLARMDPDVVLIAEASGRDGYYVSHGFDAAYDWTSQLGQWAWDGVFAPAGGRPRLGRLRAALTNGGRGYPPHTLLLRFLDNNDTGRRFITRYGVGEMRVAIELLFTLPGIPLIYDGDEVGAAFEPYEQGPPIGWRDPDGLTPLYARMAGQRRNLRTLTSPGLLLLGTDHDGEVLAYLRPGAGGDPAAVVVLNFDRSPVRVRLRDGPALNRFARATARSLATGEQWRVDLPDEALALPAYGGVIVLAGVRSHAAITPTRAKR